MITAINEIAEITSVLFNTDWNPERINPLGEIIHYIVQVLLINPLGNCLEYGF